ncbi:hypothetical protein [Spartinivicinus ruber]|uniref:hypothetical protein n=1 Tax=Spartinivicinus ruber TaxID=2683272 RepID=UPI0013D10A7D|nr:hypothetical protein [Spartinivicinus ruber]
MQNTTNHTQDHHDDRWHLDRKVSLGHIVTTAAVVISAVAFGSQMDKRIDLNASAINNMDQLYKEMRREFRADIENIDSKLDRVLERLPKK